MSINSDKENIIIGRKKSSKSKDLIAEIYFNTVCRKMYEINGNKLK